MGADVNSRSNLTYCVVPGHLSSSFYPRYSSSFRYFPPRSPKHLYVSNSGKKNPLNWTKQTIKEDNGYRIRYDQNRYKPYPRNRHRVSRKGKYNEGVSGYRKWELYCIG